MNKLVLSNNSIDIKCDDNESRELMMDLYPFTVNRSKTVYKVSPHKVIEVLQLFRGVTEKDVSTLPLKIQQYWLDEKLRRDKLADLSKNGPTMPLKINSNLTLTKHQGVGRELAMYFDRFAFFYDTRTGKTPLSLSIINDDVKKHTSHKWLVVCPLILIDQAWMPDSLKFFPEIKTIKVWSTTKAGRIKALSQQGSIYIINSESFVRYKPFLEEMNFEGCIVDESSDMKSHRSNFSKEMVNFAQTMNRFYLLSGTPAPNGEHEYYMQMRAIDYYGWQSSYTQFKEYYFINLSYEPQYDKLVLRGDRKDELTERISKSALYVDKEDVLTTPGRTFHEVEIELPQELKKYYTKMKNDLAIEVDQERSIIAPSAATKLNKLNQITSGFIMDTEAAKENKYNDTSLAEWYLLDNYRFKLLNQLLESDSIKGKQVLVWANYRREFEIIQDSLGSRCGCVYGATSINEKNSVLNNFKNGKLQYLIANPASADKGLTLTNCHTVIYFSLNYSYELFKQSYDRVYGDVSIQPNHCNYYIIIAKGTIDRVLYSDVLQGKSNASYAVLNHLKGEGYV